MRKLRLYLLIFLLSVANYSFAQQHGFLPLGEEYKQITGFYLNQSDNVVHTGFKPILSSDIKSADTFDSIIYNLKNRETFFVRHKENWFWKKLLFEDFISVKKKQFSLSVNPLLNLEYGRSSDTSTFFINTRGIEIKGTLGNKFSYYSSFRENQARFRPYIYDWTRERLVVPGQGALKKNNNDLSKYDFSGISAYLSYSPFNWFNIQLGQDKNFVGEGYRSLLLSDNAYTYPFIKFSFQYKNFKYISMFSQFRDFDEVYYSMHNRKHAAFSYISYNYKNRFEIGLFEGMIYKTSDTSSYINKFKYDFFVPVIGAKLSATGFSSTHNLLLGINAKFKIINHVQLYGQFALDDPKQRKYAYQGGIKIFDLFFSKIKQQNLYFQAEYNLASARTYSHPEDRYQSWSHYNQELSHPSGSDFSEFYLKLNYRFLNFHAVYRYNNIFYNRSSTFSDIMITDSENYLSYIDPVRVLYHSFTISYIVNPRTNLQVFAGYNIRNQFEESQAIENYFMFGLKTAINNYYYDF